MKFFTPICLLAIILSSGHSFGQTGKAQKYAHQLLTIEPAIGLHTNFGTDLLISTMVQWSPTSRLAFASHSSYNINNPFIRDFNSIRTDYNYSLNQKFGVGTTVYAKKSSHSFFLMAGVKYTSYSETLSNPFLNKATSRISAVSPDYGLLYSLKKGGKKCFFTFRAYLPIYPWPLKGSDINYVDGNLNNVALEFGLGIKIK